MRIKYYVLFSALIAAVYFYNTIWFQAFFIPKMFYQDIANVNFDVSHVGETIEIPLKFNYKTCYSLSLSVPGAWMLNSDNIAQGKLKYKFIAHGKVLTEGTTYPASSSRLSGNDNYSMVVLIVFDLPFAGEPNVVLHLEVVEPFAGLSEFKGETSIVIDPDYNAKVCKCYNEDLRIEKPE